ncbi:formylmethionine deformylase [Nocardia sp. MDA0666]|uniref:peptide deformylase n=1 Tax=Nocardia sp. MDA0666 TaxID=2135448 RepID=UPI000D11DC7A|nr:peptide deformylase [Nocardia sp. MDA0666]PSR62128.1 formylmethionine deformylase [Nocardia sp. MDA0666]
MSDEMANFIGELKRWRENQGMSQSALAKRIQYDRSYVSKVETGQDFPAPDFAKRADEVLSAGGAIRRAYKAAAQAANGQPSRSDPATTMSAHDNGLVVELEEAELHYDHIIGNYRASQRRRIRNCGTAPIYRYLIRISVDRHPGSPEYSNELYRNDPLTWEELNLVAHCDDEPMTWHVQHDRDAFKELWLLFENEESRFPLYPGESTVIDYSYTVGDDKWGQWFQRAIRLPTDRIVVRLDFPVECRPNVWGMETSMSAEALPFRDPIQRTESGDRVQFCWSTDNPPLHARYRLEWRFKNHHPKDEMPTSEVLPSERMSAIGIVQEGDPVLSGSTQPFDLPREADDARRVIAELQSAMTRVADTHTFSKGMGIAAPQIGIPRSAAVVRAPDQTLITLLNPTIIDQSVETDVQYEGCLSFFDVRGKVPRPLAIHVEHVDIDGNEQITVFERGLARLVAHEIDHLNGLLYRSRMLPGTQPIPVAQYRGTGQQWNYPA